MFQFVPRKVAQKVPRPQSSSAPAPASLPAPAVPTANPPEHSNHATSSKGKRKANGTLAEDVDLAALLWLSLSEHSLWLNVDLRRTVAAADDGWIPLSHLLHISSYSAHLSPLPPDAAFVRAIRSHAEDLLEVRMLVASPSKGVWYGKDPATKDDMGGYEIRRKDWSDALARVRNSTRNEWEARTVYMESIPLPYRSISTIYHFASRLLASSGVTPRVQGITLPRHHLDQPGDTPKCKGFALVVFADLEDATRLAEDWPWLPRRTSAPSSKPEQHTVAQEAAKFGFRVLPKARWDRLNEEHLAYRQTLLDGMTPRPRANEPQLDKVEVAAPAQAPADTNSAREDTDPSPPGGPHPDLSAPFPPGCLVFVRNVHPETNKTTLKALFTAHAFNSSSSSHPHPHPPAASAALDYVDYTKGMTSCHLRLSAPAHAQTLVHAFSACPLVQRQGLDSVGSPPPRPHSQSLGIEPEPESDTPKPITVELVRGEREALYWEKVPEKVRREAVRKAIAHACGVQNAQEDADMTSQGQGKRPRKRRKKA